MNPVTIKALKKTALKYPILIEGLPGVGNVGKIAVDFIIEVLEAKPIYEIHSVYFPHCSFVGHRGLLSLPKMTIHHKKVGTRDFLFLAGDAHPNEQGCYHVSDAIISLLADLHVKEIVTLGGFVLEEIPDHPKVYCAGSSLAMIQSFKKKKIESSAGIIGPILGMSGVLAGMAKERGIDSGILLVETFAHPTYIGVKEARHLLKAVNDRFSLKLNMKELDKEIVAIEEEIKMKIDKLMTMQQEERMHTDANYLG